MLVIAVLWGMAALTAVAAAPLRGGTGTYDTFVDGGNPTCFSPADLAAAGITPLADGARMPYGLDKLILERNAWFGQYLSSALAAILLEEALNIPVQPLDGLPADTGVYERLANGTVDINMEIWQSEHRLAAARQAGSLLSLACSARPAELMWCCVPCLLPPSPLPLLPQICGRSYPFPRQQHSWSASHQRHRGPAGAGRGRARRLLLPCMDERR